MDGRRLHRGLVVGAALLALPASGCAPAGGFLQALFGGAAPGASPAAAAPSSRSVSPGGPALVDVPPPGSPRAPREPARETPETSRGAPSAPLQDGLGGEGVGGACPDDVGLVGDSITANAGYPASLRAECPGTRFTNQPETYARVGKSSAQMRADLPAVLPAGHPVLVILGAVNNTADPAGVQEDLAAMAAEARAAGARVVGVTVLPYKGYPSWTPARGAAVRQVNAFLEAEAAAGRLDALVDAFALLGDPADPDALRAEYSADRLHPDAAGYAALAPRVVAALKHATRP